MLDGRKAQSLLHTPEAGGTQLGAGLSSRSSVECLGLELIPNVSACEHRHLVFFVRHGESEWNRGQSTWSMDAVCQMVRRHDHALSHEGIRQALRLEGDILRVKALIARSTSFSTNDLERTFLTARTILCSPLTRAVQTATIGLRPLLSGDDHATLRLIKEIRERRSWAGRDSTGTDTGLGIKNKVRTHISTQLGSHVADEYKDIISEINIDDVLEKWWDLRQETQRDVENRMRIFVRELRGIPLESGPIIVVGHSHFIREIFRRYSIVQESSSSNLSTKVLNNCGVAAAVFEFPEDSEPQITSQKNIFMSSLEDSPGVIIRFLSLAGGPKSAALASSIVLLSPLGQLSEKAGILSALSIIRTICLALLLGQALQRFLFPRIPWTIFPLWLTCIFICTF